MAAHSDSGDEDALSRLLSQRMTYEAERAALSARIRETDKNIAIIQAEYGAIYNKSSKLLRLPPEVTCMIFDHASGYPMEEEGEGEEFKAVHLLPEVVISHVCRHWREISLSYPRLWTSFSYDGPTSIRIPLERFDAYLKRSGTLDLELWIEFGYHSQGLEDDSSAKHLALLEMAIDEAHRWKRTTLILNSESAMLGTIMPKLQKVSVPRLEHFALCAEEEDLKEPSYLRNSTVVNKVETTIFEGGASNLKSLRVDGKTYVTCTPPLSNLTALRIESIINNPDSILSWTAFLSILELPSLQDLSLIGDIFEPPTPEAMKIIDMNNLKSLRYSDNDTVSLILPCIRAPLLESLTLQSVWLPEELGAMPMHPSEPYFFPSLHSLDLIDVTPSTLHGAWYLVRMTRRAKDILLSHEDAGECVFVFTPAAYRSNPLFWPDMERLTLNMDATAEVGAFVHFFNCRPATENRRKCILRIFEHIKTNWQSQFEPLYDALCDKCDIETVKLEDLAVGFWPPAEHPPDYFCEDADPFDIANAY